MPTKNFLWSSGYSIPKVPLKTYTIHVETNRQAANTIRYGTTTVRLMNKNKCSLKIKHNMSGILKGQSVRIIGRPWIFPCVRASSHDESAWSRRASFLQWCRLAAYPWPMGTKALRLSADIQAPCKDMTWLLPRVPRHRHAEQTGGHYETIR